ncbi:MAG: 4-hydroxy-3-methylbut-2-enyl diphosphate reductase [Alphaproteobacteria bacterium TMED89]|nr:4-hydroxy-3-methylbut-2-enyl diphosphate reductase [Rhodospirillaceae bacterium]RPH09854.1 MAG: 4-hydroxy-3-methylbut-2-enyl diphosphate reductase [Alphaproteobacteria bacterium TMED89]
MATAKPALTVKLAAPRGFCAGVVRAIDIVELALKKHGAPVYVRHEIVHNRFVVEGLEAKGAVFIEDLAEAPDDRPVIFSAHGVPKSVPAEAQRRNLHFVDATCPLVSKVHREAERAHADGKQVILIGHEGHPEVIGTLGQLPDGSVTLISTPEDVAGIVAALDEDGTGLAFVTQTTLSVDDTSDVISALKQRFPLITEPKAGDICYATTNRQEAVKIIAPDCEGFLVVGAPNSSNSNRLVDVAYQAGVRKAFLVQRGSDVAGLDLTGVQTMGLTAGASAPEVLVDEILDALRDRFDVTVSLEVVREENVIFNVPRELRDVA